MAGATGAAGATGEPGAAGTAGAAGAAAPSRTLARPTGSGSPGSPPTSALSASFSCPSGIPTAPAVPAVPAAPAAPAAPTVYYLPNATSRPPADDDHSARGSLRELCIALDDRVHVTRRGSGAAGGRVQRTGRSRAGRDAGCSDLRYLSPGGLRSPRRPARAGAGSTAAALRRLGAEGAGPGQPHRRGRRARARCAAPPLLGRRGAADERLSGRPRASGGRVGRLPALWSRRALGRSDAPHAGLLDASARKPGEAARAGALSGCGHVCAGGPHAAGWKARGDVSTRAGGPG